MQIISEKGFSPLCGSTLVVKNRWSVPSPAGLVEWPCSTPVVGNVCCCNCFRLDVPGFDVTYDAYANNADGLSAIPVTTTTFMLVGGGAQCQVRIGTFATVCSWYPVANGITNTNFSFQMNWPSGIATMTFVNWPGYATETVQFTSDGALGCNGGTLYLTSGGIIDTTFQKATWPSTVSIFPIPCSQNCCTGCYQVSVEAFDTGCLNAGTYQDVSVSASVLTLAYSHYDGSSCVFTTVDGAMPWSAAGCAGSHVSSSGSATMTLSVGPTGSIAISVSGGPPGMAPGWSGTGLGCGGETLMYYSAYHLENGYIPPPMTVTAVACPSSSSSS